LTRSCYEKWTCL